MRILSEALSVERARLFVGREDELDCMRDWIAGEGVPTEVLFLSGMGGMGKSALMLRFLDMAQTEGIFAIWLDGRISADTPAGFMESLNAFLIHKPLANASPNGSYRDLAAELNRRKTLLCIDNYESIHRIEGWLKEAFLPGLSSTDLLVVLASRQDLSSAWQNDLAWQSRIRHIRLGPLSRKESQRFLQLRGVEAESDRERLIGDSQGLPLAMALFAEHWGSPASETAAIALPVSLRVSAEMLREAVSPELTEALDLLCVLPHASPKQLERLLASPLNGENLQKLVRLSFVRPTAGGLALHDVARGFLVEDFKHRAPDRYETLRRQVIGELAKELREAAGQEKKRIAAVMLSACRDVFRLDSNSIFPSDPEGLQMQPFQPGDLPHLHRIIAEETEYTFSEETAHSLLDALSERYPENLHVVRSGDGIPIGFSSFVLLHKETLSWLERFLPGMLSDVFPEELGPMRRLSREQASTFFQLLSGVSSRIRDNHYYEMVGSFVGKVVLDMVMSNVEGTRFVVVTSHDQMNDLFRNLGLQSRPFPETAKKPPLSGASVYEYDLRRLDFGEHLLEVVRTLAHRGPVRQSPEIELSEKEIVAALARIDDPYALDRSELARRLSCDGPALHRLLEGVFSDRPPFPITKRNQAVLQLLSEAPLLSAELAAERLHISRATYYRARSAALSGLKEVLLRKSLSTEVGMKP